MMRNNIDKQNPSFLLSKKIRRARRTAIWMALFIFLFVVSLIIFLFAEVFQAFAVIILVLIVLLTLGLILLNDEFRALFSSGAAETTAMIKSTGLTLTIIFGTLMLLTIVIYVLQKRAIKKLEKSHNPEVIIEAEVNAPTQDIQAMNKPHLQNINEGPNHLKPKSILDDNKKDKQFK